jgi:hypothetical protein
MDWWPDHGNVIMIDTHYHDRSARDETSYPPTNPLSIISFILVGSFFLIEKHFIAFSTDPWVEHMEGLYIGFYLLANSNPSSPSSPSSHRMRDNPFLGQYTLKSQETRKWEVLGDVNW